MAEKKIGQVEFSTHIGSGAIDAIGARDLVEIAEKSINSASAIDKLVVGLIGNKEPVVVQIKSDGGDITQIVGFRKQGSQDDFPASVIKLKDGTIQNFNVNEEPFVISFDKANNPKTREVEGAVTDGTIVEIMTKMNNERESQTLLGTQSVQAETLSAKLPVKDCTGFEIWNSIPCGPNTVRKR